MVLAYFAGLLPAGLVAGLLRPLGRFLLGAMGLGIVGAIFAYGAVGIATEGPALDGRVLIMGLVLGLLVGPAAGLSLYVDPPWRSWQSRAG